MLNKYFSSVKELVIYFNGIQICANTKDKHDIILEQVIGIAKKNNIIFNKNKIQYFLVRTKRERFDFDRKRLCPLKLCLKIIHLFHLFWMEHIFK